MGGEVALIVGGGSGVSASRARLFARDGPVRCHRCPSALQAGAARLGHYHGVRRYTCDAAGPPSIAAMFEQFSQDLWPPRLVVHNIDGRLRELFRDLRFGEFDVLVGINLLRELGYSLQANRKTLEGASHPDRDAQFQYISDQVKAALAANQPAISVDPKKKELVGDFRNNGRDYRPKGDPEKVRVHDFKIPDLGRAAPYGVYDIADNTGWVSVGIDHDTATFAVNSIRRWWQTMGQKRYPNARLLLITADGAGSIGSRVRLWKIELQTLADDLDIEITVCHLPPGTSKWNKIEHRLFSFITQNWRGRTLVSYQSGSYGLRRA